MTPITGFLISADKDEQPKQLAEMFCKLFADQQAAFFNEVAVISGAWDVPREIQWRYMQDHLSVGGKRVVDEISEHTSDEDEATS
jgi:hypothetical protein